LINTSLSAYGQPLLIIWVEPPPKLNSHLPDEPPMVSPPACRVLHVPGADTDADVSTSGLPWGRFSIGPRYGFEE
jgi:hypothetical protein